MSDDINLKSLFWRGFWLVMGLVILFSAVGYVFGVFGEGAEVMREEFGPKALRDKYEMFKDMHAQLGRKQADIAMYREQLNDTAKGSEDYRLLRQEMMGIVSSYNNLAAQYNSAMAKVNYRFANVGGLPEGSTDTLPRNYAPYSTSLGTVPIRD